MATARCFAAVDLLISWVVFSSDALGLDECCGTLSSPRVDALLVLPFVVGCTLDERVAPVSEAWTLFWVSQAPLVTERVLF